MSKVTKYPSIFVAALVATLMMSCSSSEEAVTLEAGDTFVKNDIGYRVLSFTRNSKTAEVISCGGGEVTIPATVSYGGNDYQVETVNFQSGEQPVTSLTLSEGIKSVELISDGLGVCHIKKLMLPGSMEYATNAFMNCRELEGVCLSEGIKGIRYGSFQNARLKELHIPASMTERMVDEPFYVDRLEKIVVASDNPVFSHGDKENALIYKPTQELVLGNSSAYIPEGVKTVCQHAFHWSADYDGEVTVNIPEGVERIEREAFSMPVVSSITIPASVTEVLEQAFACDVFSGAVKIADGPEELQFQDQYGTPARSLSSRFGTSVLSLDEVYVGRNTKLFVLNAFEPNPPMKLGVLTIGPMVSSINWNTYEEWTVRWSVESIVSLIEHPELVEPNFPEYVFQESTLYVPGGLKEAYMNTAWGKFSKIEEGDKL